MAKLTQFGGSRAKSKNSAKAVKESVPGSEFIRLEGGDGMCAHVRLTAGYRGTTQGTRKGENGTIVVDRFARVDGPDGKKYPEITGISLTFGKKPNMRTLLNFPVEIMADGEVKAHGAGPLAAVIEELYVQRYEAARAVWDEDATQADLSNAGHTFAPSYDPTATK